MYRTWTDLSGATLGYIGDYYNIRGISYISHGAWVDPELVFCGKSFNLYDVENTLWDMYCEEAAHDTGHGFGEWMNAHADRVKEVMAELSEMGCKYNGESYAYIV